MSTRESQQCVVWAEDSGESASGGQSDGHGDESDGDIQGDIPDCGGNFTPSQQFDRIVTES